MVVGDYTVGKLKTFKKVGNNDPSAISEVPGGKIKVSIEVPEEIKEFAKQEVTNKPEEILKKLEEKAIRYNEVNELVQDPDLIKDQKKYKDVMREHSHLSALMEAYAEYKDHGCGGLSGADPQAGFCRLPDRPAGCSQPRF